MLPPPAPPAPPRTLPGCGATPSTSGRLATAGAGPVWGRRGLRAGPDTTRTASPTPTLLLGGGRRPGPRPPRALPDGGGPGTDALLPSPASLALLAAAAALGYAGWRILLWDYRTRRTDDPSNPDRADSFSIRAGRPRRTDDGGGAPLLRPTPRWGLPPWPARAKPPPLAKPRDPRTAALLTQGLILVAARAVLDRIGEAAAVFEREGGVPQPSSPTLPTTITTLAPTAAGRREQARALAADAAGRGCASPGGAALERVAELAAADQCRELLGAVREMQGGAA